VEVRADPQAMLLSFAFRYRRGNLLRDFGLPVVTGDRCLCTGCAMTRMSGPAE